MFPPSFRRQIRQDLTAGYDVRMVRKMTSGTKETGCAVLVLIIKKSRKKVKNDESNFLKLHGN
ncbi:hypothetical protein DW954_01045 [Clostridium sp. AM45-5]|nr:hypothetical protein DW954_01045 [Clostridium sp. AM45-5]